MSRRPGRWDTSRRCLHRSRAGHRRSCHTHSCPGRCTAARCWTCRCRCGSCSCSRSRSSPSRTRSPHSCIGHGLQTERRTAEQLVRSRSHDTGRLSPRSPNPTNNDPAGQWRNWLTARRVLPSRDRQQFRHPKEEGLESKGISRAVSPRLPAFFPVLFGIPLPSRPASV